MLLAWLAVCAVVVAAQKDELATEVCVVVPEASLWDVADPKDAVPSSLSPAIRGDRLRVTEVRGAYARVTAESFFPRSVWIAKEAVAPCAVPESPTVSLAAEVARSRALVRELKSKVIACAEAGTVSCEDDQNRLLSAMEELKRLCDADPECRAARKTKTN